MHLVGLGWIVCVCLLLAGGRRRHGLCIVFVYYSPGGGASRFMYCVDWITWIVWDRVDREGSDIRLRRSRGIADRGSRSVV